MSWEKGNGVVGMHLSSCRRRHGMDHRGSLVALIAAYLLSACATDLGKTIKIGATEKANTFSGSVLWPRSFFHPSFFTLGNSATVIRVDDTEIHHRSTDSFLIELSAENHEVTIKFERQTLSCWSPGGCDFIERARKKFTLNAEAGHSYFPVSRRICGKNWIWIVDRGKVAADELRSWKELHRFPAGYWRYEHLSGLKVVAGEAPPEKCEDD